MDEFLKGVSTATEGTEDKKKKAYYIGVMVGVQLNMMQQSFGNQIFEGDSTKTLSLKNLVAGFVAGSTNKDAKMTSEQARTFLQKKSQELQAKQAEKKFADNKKKRDAYQQPTTHFLLFKTKEVGYYQPRSPESRVTTCNRCCHHSQQGKDSTYNAKPVIAYYINDSRSRGM